MIRWWCKTKRAELARQSFSDSQSWDFWKKFRLFWATNLRQSWKVSKRRFEKIFIQQKSFSNRHWKRANIFPIYKAQLGFYHRKSDDKSRSTEKRNGELANFPLHPPGSYNHAQFVVEVEKMQMPSYRVIPTASNIFVSHDSECKVHDSESSRKLLWSLSECLRFDRAAQAASPPEIPIDKVLSIEAH